MNTKNQNRVDKRTIGRRQEDLETWDRNLRYQQLFVLGQTITSEMNMDALFQLIMSQTNQIMNTERSTIFLADEEKEELWSLVATGMEKNEIRIHHDSGVAGWVYQHRKPLTINDPYNDKRFNLGVDKQSGFGTRNLLCVPVVNRNGRCIGVLQALNSQLGSFSNYDTHFLESIADYVAIAVENARLYEEIKAYSEKLKATIIQNENLEKAKARLFLTRPSLMTYTEKREDLVAHAEDLFDVVESNAVKIEISQTYPLSEAARGHRDLENRKTMGSSILLP